MKYLIHHVKVEMWPALCSHLIFSNEIQIKTTFSQVIIIFKIGTSKFFSNLQREEKLGFLNVASPGIVSFSQFLVELPSFPHFTKQLRN